MEDDAPAVVIDNGSGGCKAGLSDTKDGAPYAVSVVPSIVGRPCHVHRQALDDEADSDDEQQAPRIYVGHEASYNKANGDLNLDYTYQCPIKQGIITNWDDMEEVRILDNGGRN